MINELFVGSETESMVHVEDRLLLITKARWIFIALLGIYGIATAFAYANAVTFSKYLSIIKIPLICLVVMVLYNSFYHWGWHAIPQFWKKYVHFFIVCQALIDITIATVFIHFTGGILSWFWGLYILITLELTFLIPSQVEVFLVGGYAMALYTLLIASEYFGLLTPVKMPFLSADIQQNLTYVLIVWLWVCIANYSTLMISTYMHGKEKLAARERIVKDALTNLYNRRHFNHTISNEVSRAKRYDRIVSLLIIDIDNFKRFNDSFGHPVGDDMLRMISMVLQNNIRRGAEEGSDGIDIVCRYGGDEFAVILPETGIDETVEAADKLRDEFNKNIDKAYVTAERLRETVEKTTTSSNIGTATLSIGIASYPVHAKNSKELIKKADEAMYVAKSSGRNTTIIAKADIIEPDKVLT